VKYSERTTVGQIDLIGLLKKVDLIGLLVMLLLESQNWEKATEKKNAEKMFLLAPMVNSSTWTD
jgi:hypothetical protein